MFLNRSYIHLLLSCSLALSAPAAFAAADAAIEPQPAVTQPAEPKVASGPGASGQAAGSRPAANQLPTMMCPGLPKLTSETPQLQTGDSSSAGGDSIQIGVGSQPSAPDLMVDEVKIEGNRLVPTEEIIGVVKTKAGDKFDRDMVMQDLKAINGMGYFNDGGLQAEPQLTDKKKVLLKIRVQENAPVTEFSFQGNKVLSSDEINQLFADQLGKPQNLNQLSAAIDRVEQAYHAKGYVLARVTDVKDDPDGSIGLNINEGMIDGIQISGNHKTKGFIIKNAIKIKPGQVYNERQLTADLRKLYGNGYFQDIRRSLAPSQTDPDKYTLKVEVEEKRTGSIGLGGGVDTLFGPFGSLNFSDANFRGRGQVLSFTSQVGTGMMNNLANSVNNGGTNFLASQRTFNVQADFVEPNLLGTNTTMTTSMFGRDYASMMISQAMQQTIGASVNLSKPLGNGFSANLGLTGENTFMKDVSGWGTNSIVAHMMLRALATGQGGSFSGAQALVNQVRNQQLKGGTYLSVSPSISYDTRDAAIDPSRGTYARMTGTPSLGLTGGSFVKLGASVSKFIPVNDSTTLALNTQAGTSFGAVPMFAQYRLGGWNGVRGYSQFSALGTGTSMLMGTAEMRTHLPFLRHNENKYAQMVDKHLKIAGFVDYGQVGGNGLSNGLMGMNQMGAAVGVGLRIKVPMVGMVRIDAGLPIISSIMGNYTPRITFGFGEKF